MEYSNKLSLLYTNAKAFAFAIALVALCSPSASAFASLPLARPNIVLIVADYMGYGDIEPYGAKDIRTPSLASLAQEGVKYTNYYAAAPVCIPSRASLMSGLYPAKSLARKNLSRGVGLPAERNTLLQNLKAAGYATAMVGKWHLGAEEGFKPNDHGFDYYYGFNAWTLGHHDHLTSDGEPGLYRNDELLSDEGYLTELFSKEATRFIESKADAPFFLYLSYNAGLPPYQRPDLARSKWGSGWDANDASRADYVSMVESMDQGIATILKKLEEKKLVENTLLIFTYDHGGRHLVDSGPLFHGFSTLWEGGIRVPLIIRWPNEIQYHSVVYSPAIAMDLTATMINAAQPDKTIEALDGINLAGIAKDGERFKERPLFWRHGNMKAVRQGDWKYIVDGHSQLLFNLHTDISERKNVFHQHPNKVRHLKGLLDKWELSLSP